MRPPWLWIAFLLLTCSVQAHKVQVSDPSRASAIIVRGGRLLADYGGYQLLESGETNGLIVRDAYNSILLRAGPLDTSLPQTQALRHAAESFPGKRLHLLHFAGPIQPAWRQALRNLDLQIVDYIPQNAYLVYGTAAALAKIRPFPLLQWDGAYLADYKTNRFDHLEAGDPLAIQLVSDPAVNEETLRLLEGPVQSRHVMHYLNVFARVPRAGLAVLAGRSDVLSIRPLRQPKKLCERQDQIVAGNLNGRTLTGPGYLAWLTDLASPRNNSAPQRSWWMSPTVALTMARQPNHFGLYVSGQTNAASRVAYCRLEGTPNPGSTLRGCDGHGTLNGHIVAGYSDGAGFPFADDLGYHYGLGVCPFVLVGSSVIFDPDNATGNISFSQLQDQAYENGARISNNSWGEDGTDGSYGLLAQEFDALVRDAQPTNSPFSTPGNQEMTIVFAAGNLGPAGQTIDEPATAKNIVAVGGADNIQPFGGYDGCDIGDDQADNADEILNISSRGPCADGRHKPDLVAPATHVSGGVPQAPDPGDLGTEDPCYSGDSVCGGIESNLYPPGQQFYTASSGTSHSCACVAGGCALLRQYFINQSLPPPSPAMTKAWLINSARYVTGPSDNLWSDTQGMGEMNLGTAFDGLPRLIRDERVEDTFTASGQSHSFSGAVANTNLPFRVTVAWTDAPGNTSGAAFNNDLDLTVSVGGQTYLGNVFNGAWSITGGAPDQANNVESVFIPAGVVGAFTITIAAISINSVGVPNDSNSLCQDFALVVDNAAYGGSLGPVSPTLANPVLLGTNFIFSLQTVSNQTYMLQQSISLENADWNSVLTFTGDGSVRTLTNAVTSSAAFYRVASP